MVEDEGVVDGVVGGEKRGPRVRMLEVVRARFCSRLSGGE